MTIFCDSCKTMFEVADKELIAVCPVCEDIWLLDDRDEESV